MKNVTAWIVLFLAIPASGQTSIDFTGHWCQQRNSRAQRQFEIEQNGRTLRVKSVVANSEGTRNLEVKYEIGGARTCYTGLDGDEFCTSVRWDGRTLVFETTEHEGGSDIPQKAVWSLSEDGKTLQVDRSVTKAGKTTDTQTAYVRQP